MAAVRPVLALYCDVSHLRLCPSAAETITSERKTTDSNVLMLRTSYTLLSSAVLVRRFLGSLLFGASARENATHGVIPLMTRVLIDPVVRQACHWTNGRPRP